MSPLNRSAIDRLVSRDQPSAGIGLHAMTVDQLMAHGRFHVKCTAPDPADLSDYLILRDSLAAHEAAGAWHDADMLRREMLAIPQHEVWRMPAPNLVVTTGKNYLLDNGLAGVGYTATLYIGLITNAGYSAIVAGDTMASHAGWAESTAYSNATRIVTAWSAASAGSKSLSSALAFLANATDTIKGCFMTTSSTKGGTTGTLYSAGLFTGGDQPIVNGNTLNVSYTAGA